MRKLFLSILFVFGLMISVQTANAQTFNDKSDFYVGYQFTRQNPDLKTPSFRFNQATDTNGVNGSYTYYFNNKSVGAGAEASVDFGSNSTHVFTYLGTVTLKKRTGNFNPFVSGKLGVTNVTVGNPFRTGFNTSTTGYAYGGAVGLDLKVSKKVSYRLLQVDLLRSNQFGTPENTVRLGTGFIF